MMTLTDVEDKAIAEAKTENISVEELTHKNETQLYKDFDLLRVDTPSLMVRASTAVTQSAKLVDTLIKKGHAYWLTHEGRRNVYFEPTSFLQFGKLAHLDMNKWPKTNRHFHKDTYPGTRWNKGDFIIWHGCKDNDVCWNTEIGRGRPAWNIQDAAIVTQNFGFHADIACGGIDNLVRHHDYTLAIAESVSGKVFADHWLHCAHLLVNELKMSKSKGNVVYPNHLLTKGFTGDQIRFFLIYGHYSKRLNFTVEKLQAVCRRLKAFKEMVADLRKATSSTSREGTQQIVSGILPSFEQCMNNDLDVKGAFDSVFKSVSRLDRLRKHAELSTKDADSAIAALERADRVFAILS